ncbi:hypothetical protein GOODEAATRI_004394, partial [Goodea atripinnis]
SCKVCFYLGSALLVGHFPCGVVTSVESYLSRSLSGEYVQSAILQPFIFITQLTGEHYLPWSVLNSPTADTHLLTKEDLSFLPSVICFYFTESYLLGLTLFYDLFFFQVTTQCAAYPPFQSHTTHKSTRLTACWRKFLWPHVRMKMETRMLMH